MRILMLGNSLTTANGLPSLLAERLQAEVVVHARGGARLSEHLNPKTKLGAKTARALAEGGWDCLVLQERSDGPVRFPTAFAESARKLSEAARAVGAIPILYATWAYAPGSPKLAKLGLSHDEMHGLMTAANHAAARDAGALLADACGAFHEHLARPKLYAPDGVHPTSLGTRVALDCIADAIAGASQSPATTAAGGASFPHSPGKRPVASEDAMPAADAAREAHEQLREERRTGADEAKAPAGGPPGTGRADAPVGPRTAPYTVYLLECEDGSYYAGITTDIGRRLEEHRSRGPKAAKYTRTHPVVALAATWEAADRAQASRMEYRIKRLTHAQKAALAADPSRLAGFLQSGTGSDPA